jgi:flagellar biosynthesis chaperone FliJ
LKKAHPLSAVLRLRHLAEEQQERLLEKILQERARTEDLLRKEQQLILDAYRERESIGKSVLASELLSSYAKVTEHSERVTKFDEQRQKLEDLADQQRNVLQKARQQRETVESIVVRHQEQAAVCERRREQNRLDDIHGAQRVRKQLSAASAQRQDKNLA